MNQKKNTNEKDFKIGDYIIKKTLGQGTFGKVKLGIYIPTNEKYAIKILEKSRIREKDDEIRVKREFQMLQVFNNINVILVAEIFETIDSYYSVMEFCEGGELFNYIVKKRRLSEEESAFFYYQIIKGLEYIHSLGIVHRDLKPENLLLTKSHILKIIDFGLSNYFNEDNIKNKKLLSTPCGSPCYASPEMVAGKKYNGFKIDVWSTGIILYAMLCGYLPFEDKDNDLLFKKILECKLEFPHHLTHNSRDLIRRILVTNPDKRITIPEIKKHEFYRKGKIIFFQEFSFRKIPKKLQLDTEDFDYKPIQTEGNINKEKEEKKKIEAEKIIKTEENRSDKKKNNIKIKDEKNLKSNKSIDNEKDNNDNNNIDFNDKVLNTEGEIKQDRNNLDLIDDKISKTKPNTLQRNVINKLTEDNSIKKNNKSKSSSKNKKIKTLRNSMNNKNNIGNFTNIYNLNSVRYYPFNTTLFTKKQNYIIYNNKENSKNNYIINFNILKEPNLFLNLAHKNNNSTSKPKSALKNSINNYKSERKKPNLHISDILDFYPNYNTNENKKVPNNNENYGDYVVKTQENYQIKTGRKLDDHFNYRNFITQVNFEKKHGKINSMKLGNIYKNNLKNNNRRHFYNINGIGFNRNNNLNNNVSRLSTNYSSSKSKGKKSPKNFSSNFKSIMTKKNKFYKELLSKLYK